MMDFIARTSAMALWAATLLPACSPADEHRLLGDEEDRRLAERRRRMNVQIIDENGDPAELDPLQLWELAAASCEAAAESLSGHSCAVPDSITPSLALNCRMSVCVSSAALCLANRYLELGAALEPIEIGDTIILPQSNATRAGFYESATFLLQSAIAVSGEALRSAYVSEAEVDGELHNPNMFCDTDAGGDSDSLDTTLGGVPASRLLIGNLAEGSAMLREAVGEAVRRNVADADTELARTPDRVLATRAAWHDPFLSRGNAARLAFRSLDPKYSTFIPYGLPPSCAIPPISRRGRTALRHVRASGVSPTLIRAEQPADDFLWSENINDPGVIERLQALFDLPNPGGDPADQVEAFLRGHSLSRSDFIEARAFIRCELDSFPRDELEVELGPNNLQLFTAVTNEPRHSRGHEVWADLLIAEADFELVESGNEPVWQPFLAMRGAANTLDYVRRLATELVAVEVDSMAGDLLAQDEENFLASVAVQSSLRTKARVQACASESSGAYAVTVTVFDDGQVPSEDYLVLAGRPPTSCALFGDIDGHACTVDGYRDGSWSSSPAPAGSGYARQLVLSYLASPIDGGLEDFVLVRRAGLSGRPPGGYDPVAPVVVPAINALTSLNAGEKMCESVPHSAEDINNVERSLSPGVDSPSEPETSCEDISSPFVPLEAELHDDGDRYESSYRRMLETARSAAELADLLADQHISQGLDVDVRAEAAQRELQQLCGVTVDLSRVFDPELGDQTDGECMMGECAEGYRCLDGVCMADIIQRINAITEDERTRRVLANCLGGIGSVRPVVGLGTGPLCVWRKDDDPTLLCDPAGITPPAMSGGLRHQCPYRMDAAVCATSLDDGFSVATGYTAVEVTDYLGFFQEQTEEGEPVGPAGAMPEVDCFRTLHTLRTLPSGDSRTDILEALIASNTITQPRARAAAERLGWAGYPGDHGTILLDRIPKATTGDPRVSDPEARFSDEWPCVESTLSSCGFGARALFCQQITQCNDRVQRSAFNDRVIRAMITLGIISGHGLSNLELPHAIPNTGVPDPLTAYTGVIPSSNTYYLFDATSTPATLQVYGQGGWESSGRHSWGGRTYFLLDPAESGPIWTGRAVGHLIGMPDALADCQGTAYYPHGYICPLRLRQRTGADTTPQERIYRQFMFARFNDDFIWRDPGSRDVWLAGLWSGTSTTTSSGTAGAIRVALGSADESRESALHREFREHTWIIGRGSSGGDGGISADPVGQVDFGHAEGNYARVFDYGVIRHGTLTHQTVLDALELMCATESFSDWEEVRCAETPPPLNAEADIPGVRRYMSCLASQLEQAAERMIVQNVPLLVLDATHGDGSIAPLDGDFGRAVSGAREALLALREQPRGLAAQLRGFEGEMESLQIALRTTEIQHEIVDWRMAQEAVSAIATCGEVAENASGGRFAGVARCTASLANLAISFRIRDLQSEALDLDRAGALGDFRRAMETRVDNLQRIDAQVRVLIEQLNGHMATLNTAQVRGRSLLANAMFHGSTLGRSHLEETDSVSPVNVAMRRRYTTGRERYQAAFWRATRAAVLARQAIEQRLGMTFAEMPNTLALYDGDPRLLNRSSCSFEGIDYERIRDAGWTGDDGTTPRTSYADGYIGDYVRDLQAVLDSYPYAFPYTDGSDTVVLSLRDDVLGVRRSCSVPTYNELRGTADVTVNRSWLWADCDPESTGELCIGVRRLEASDDPGPRNATLAYLDLPSQAIQGYRFDFGAESVGSSGAVTPDSRFFTQAEDLPAGTYRLSWYGRQVGAGPLPDDVVYVSGFDGSISTSPHEIAAMSEQLATGWSRYFLYFDVLTPGVIEVGVTPGTAFETSVELGGFMLERVLSVSASEYTDVGFDPDTDPVRLYPRAFIGTGDDGMAPMPACEDTGGHVFRGGWRTGCDMLCDDGFAGSCTDPRPLCYWEQEFTLSQAEIAAGRQLSRTGFAYGNFNYRIERIGVNVVGTGTRDCSGTESPSTCYSTATVPYSLYHVGDYGVINHQGNPLRVAAFPWAHRPRPRAGRRAAPHEPALERRRVADRADDAGRLQRPADGRALSLPHLGRAGREIPGHRGRPVRHTVSLLESIARAGRGVRPCDGTQPSVCSCRSRVVSSRRTRRGTTLPLRTTPAAPSRPTPR
ncbi:MAG: hypothetical protein M5U28_46870 [Sandaracinaceae bacterium]|nr:hypothetical protein [Sandaracinaceae bacterium]